MNHIIAIIVALFTSIMTNTSFSIADDKSYTADSYYSVTDDSAPDYRELYSSSVTASNKTSSKTTNFSALGKQVSYTDSITYKGMWLENNTAMTQANIPQSYQYTFQSSCYIIAPYDAILESSSTSNDGHTMVVQCTIGSKVYRLTFANMDRWYMDVGRTAPTAVNGVVTWVHTGSDIKGWKFSMGNVLGVAVAGSTSVQVDDITGGTAVPSTLMNLYTAQ